MEIFLDKNNIIYWQIFASVLAEYYGSNQMKGLNEFELRSHNFSSGVNAVNNVELMRHEMERYISLEGSDYVGCKTTGVQFSQTVMHLIKMENIISTGSFDITPYLPLTKAGNLPKNRKIELVDSGCTCVYSGDYSSVQRLALGLRTCNSDAFTDFDSYHSQKLSPNQAILGLYTVKKFDKPDPVLNIDGTVRQRNGVIKKKDLVSGVVYECSTGGNQLYVGKAHVKENAIHGWEDDVFIFVKMTKNTMKIYNNCTSVAEFLPKLEKDASEKGKYLQDIISMSSTCKKVIGIAEGFKQIQGVSGVLQTEDYLFNFM